MLRFDHPAMGLLLLMASPLPIAAGQGRGEAMLPRFEKDAELFDRFKDAQKLLQTKDYIGSEDKLNRLRLLAEGQRDVPKADIVGLQILRARNLQRWRKESPASFQSRYRDVDPIERALRDALKAEGTADQRRVVTNNLAVHLVERGPEHAAEAVRLLRELTVDARLPSGDRAIYHYNLGRALNRANETKEALKHYDAAVRADPRSSRIIRSVFKSLRQEPDAPQRVLALVRYLVSEGQVLLAQEQAWEFLDEQPLNATGGLVRLEALVECYVASSLKKEVFTSAGEAASQAARLRRLAGREPPLGPAIASILKCFDATDLPTEMSPAQSQELFGAWSSEGQRALMSRLLVMVATQFEFQGNIAQCYARNAAAWNLDPVNHAAAAKTLELLDRHRTLLDPKGEGAPRLIERIDSVLAQLLDAKTNAYTKGAWPDALSLHLLLGALLHDDRLAERGSFYDPYYHWTRAISVADKLRAEAQRNRETSLPSGRPYLKRAELLERRGQLAAAEADFRAATESFTADGFQDAAKVALHEFIRVGLALGSSPPTWSQGGSDPPTQRRKEAERLQEKIDRTKRR